MKVKTILTVLLTAVILIAAVLPLASCATKPDPIVAQQNAAAARLQAEAELARAEASRESAKAAAEADRTRAIAEKTQVEAEASQKRMQADTSAAAERAALRQTERDAAYERTLGLLPFVLLIAGLVAIGGLAVVALAGGLRRQPAADPALMFLLQRQQEQLTALERAAYHQIATAQRQQLAAGVGPVIIYDQGDNDYDNH